MDFLSKSNWWCKLDTKHGPTIGHAHRKVPGIWPPGFHAMLWRNDLNSHGTGSLLSCHCKVRHFNQFSSLQFISRHKDHQTKQTRSAMTNLKTHVVPSMTLRVNPGVLDNRKVGSYNVGLWPLDIYMYISNYNRKDISTITSLYVIYCNMM